MVVAKKKMPNKKENDQFTTSKKGSDSTKQKDHQEKGGLRKEFGGMKGKEPKMTKCKTKACKG